MNKPCSPAPTPAIDWRDDDDIEPMDATMTGLAAPSFVRATVAFLAIRRGSYITIRLDGVERRGHSVDALAPTMQAWLSRQAVHHVWNGYLKSESGASLSYRFESDAAALAWCERNGIVIERSRLKIKPTSHKDAARAVEVNNE